MQGPPRPSPQHFHQHTQGHHRVPEHATSKTQPTKAYIRDIPRHPERSLPYRTVAGHFETWFELASAGQFDGQGDHPTPAPCVEKVFGFAETSFSQVSGVRHLCPRLCAGTV